MASACARRTLQSSSSSAATLFCGLKSFSTGGPATKMNCGFSSAAPAFFRSSRHRLSFISRSPVELGCAQSLMPLHSVTASALLTSMLSFKSGNWGWLSEGFATTL
ncbi:protein NUCLEAR FUSION DEFECTIVE 6, mitochondrial-like [Magnolia sinica]|uniref:protein NUCLEAR FUSION DEFECTIVE 6, mitochondrial-like n=1 Tax=Magnolia sinica TaxID=86752 RepID=UPI002658ECFA|nr:protein NUCLEAR FUSION DEFECTIVE 6, mitochondrial-like [Magnolia sinica]